MFAASRLRFADASLNVLRGRGVHSKIFDNNIELWPCGRRVIIWGTKLGHRRGKLLACPVANHITETRIGGAVPGGELRILDRHVQRFDIDHICSGRSMNPIKASVGSTPAGLRKSYRWLSSIRAGWFVLCRALIGFA